MSSQPHNPATGASATDTAMHELLASNRKRRNVRRWIGLGSLPVLLIAALLVIKILSMYAFAHQSIRSFVSMDFGTSVAMAKWQGPLNWFEPYKADYNLGTGLAELGELEEARAHLELALPLAPELEVCAVRYNLATVIERQGDRATSGGNEDQGQAFYLEALEILGAAPEGCGDQLADAASPDHERPMQESLIELTKRIMEKIKQQSQNPDPNQGQNGEGNPNEGEQPPEQETPSDSQLEELKKKLQSGAEERQQRDQGQSGGSGGGTDRPW